MSNFLSKIGKALANKNTLTILVVMGGIVAIWFVYNSRINSATSPITVVYAKETITAGTLITDDMLGTVKVSSDFINTSSIYKTKSEVIGKYVAENSSIAVGGLFYKSLISSTAINFRDKVGDDEKIFILDENINLKTTYGNSIMPDDYIDIYAKYTDGGVTYYGKFVTSIKVLAVRDSSSKDVFAQSPYGTPAIMYFAVSSEVYNLFNKAIKANVSLYPIPRGKNYTDTAGEMQISKQIKDYVNATVLDS